MAPHRDRYRSFRRFWWFRPGVLIPAVILLLLSAPMVWWISTYESTMAVVMFVVTYVALLVIVVLMMRSTILEPHIKVHERVLREEHDLLQEHRRRSRASVTSTELELLSKGELTPVLDLWQLDPSLRNRHPFIDDTRTCRVDPAAGELQVRIHLDSSWTLDGTGNQDALLLRETASYLRLLAGDASTRALRPYVSTVVLSLYVVREDRGFSGTPVPVLSLSVPWNDLHRASPHTRPPLVPGDLRFAAGSEIELHRDIPAGAGTGSK